MTQTDRLYKIQRWLESARCVTRECLLRELEVSRATLKRDLQYLRERLDAPIVYDRGDNAYRFGGGARAAAHQLPGLWFSDKEIHALLTMQHLLAHLDAGGLLGPHIEPLMQRLHQLLGSGAPPKADVARRIRVHTVGARRVHLAHFQAIGSALLRRQRLVLRYRGRSRDDRSEREVSPQRLVHYRDNWYLDAWCHWRQALRSFSVDAIEQVRVLDRACIDIADAELDELLGTGYGIFAGREVQWARLRFTPERSRWVAAESWHPKQRGSFDAQGRWNLDLPYADPRELVMDTLRHVPEVQVLWPQELAAEVKAKLVGGIGRLDE